MRKNEWPEGLEDIMVDRNLYHERQVKELCALHALNNLFQDSNAFSKETLDSLCYSLSPNHFINPHKSMLGLGNYDVNVLMAALHRKQCEAVWFDKRKDVRCLELKNIIGFILNIPFDYKLGFFKLPLKRKHWIAIREINGIFYNLDSKLELPDAIGKKEELLIYLQEQLDYKDRELFVIVKKEVESSRSWKKAEPSISSEQYSNHTSQISSSNNLKSGNYIDSSGR